MANKNSSYVQSLVSFILDTKPYHSKLTDIVEEYRFFDDMAVRIDERLFSNVTSKSTWLYNHFADGISAPSPQTKIHRLVSPLFRQFPDNAAQAFNKGAFKVNRDENTDLPGVPLAFDPTHIEGVGLADAFVQRNGLGTRNEALLEGHDVFQSHGAHVFQITQTINTRPKVLGRFSQEFTAFEPPDFSVPVVYPQTVVMPFEAATMVVVGPAVQISNTEISVQGPGLVTATGLSAEPNYDPLYVEQTNKQLFADVTSISQVNALDKTNPASCVSRIQVLLDAIGESLLITPNSEASTALNAVQAIIDAGDLPNSYDELLQALTAANTPVPAGDFDLGSGKTQVAVTWDDVHGILKAYSPSILFNNYTDIGARRSGAVAYEDVLRDDVVVKNIEANPFRQNYEEWTLEAATENTFFVRGSASGVIGVASLPGVFSSSYVNFELVQGVDEVVVGTEIVLSPSGICIHADAPCEAWSIIKVNPLAYSRPLFTSTRYGYIQDAAGTRDVITIDDSTIPTGAITIEAVNSNTFNVTHSDGSVYGTAQVGVPFNNGAIQFTIVAGSAYTFQPGDKFYIQIQNDLAEISDLGLDYGFDLDSFDANDTVYNTVNSALQDFQRKLEFAWGSRFTGYDWETFNLQIEENAVQNREWRLRALANVSRPLQLQNSSPENKVNLIASEDPLNPDAASQFDMANDVTSEGIQSSTDPNVEVDLQLWYADSFAVEYFNTSLSMWIGVGTANVGEEFTSATHGISFTLAPASKPFIAAKLHSSWYARAVNGTLTLQAGYTDGGDIFYWRVTNNPPKQIGPAGLVSVSAPRLVMHGDSYHFTKPATWFLKFVNSQQYTVQGYYTSGAQNGQPVFPSPKTISLNDGRSFYSREDGLHWTVKNGLGLGAGDQFTFETYEDKPIFLVHGSNSGWQEDAEIGKFYWNGKIGFKVEEPVATLFENGVIVEDWQSSIGAVELHELRYDVPSCVYRAVCHNTGYWTLYRDGEITASGISLLEDQYLRVSLPAGVAGNSLTINVTASEMNFGLGHDLAIIRTSVDRAPTTNDFVLFSRTREDRIGISVKALDTSHGAALENLHPVFTDPRFVDHTTGSGVPLSVTSPETAVAGGWLPTLVTKFDSATSTAVFSDTATIYEVRSAVLDQKIGTVRPLNTGSSEVVFEWDSGFAATYLPLNAEANIATFSAGMNEPVSVHISEGVHFLLSGSGLKEDALFTDVFTVNFEEANLLKIKSSYSTDFGVAVADGPFGGFLPGFDNLPFDFEAGGDIDSDSWIEYLNSGMGPDGQGNPPVGHDPGNTGSFDAGHVFSNIFQRARELALQNVLTPQEQAEYNDLLGLLGPYTEDPGTMTYDQFIALLDADPPINYTPQYFGFGVPAIGMAMEITDRQTEVAGSKVQEAATLRVADFGYTFDALGYDVGEMDSAPDSFVVVVSPSAPPIPLTGLPSGPYVDFDTPLSIPSPGARVIDLTFINPVINTPQIYVWLPDNLAPQLVYAVERISDRAFRFSLNMPSEAKLVVV